MDGNQGCRGFCPVSTANPRGPPWPIAERGAHMFLHLAKLTQLLPLCPAGPERRSGCWTSHPNA
eukprot:scaffold3443_cov404-Prasinococcus_capsulatus_cf.AAC.5